MRLFDVLIFFQEHRICIWFKNDEPHFNIDGILYVKGMVKANKRIDCSEEEEVMIDYLLSDYKMYRTVFHYPFLIYPNFIWKEGIIYSTEFLYNI